MKIYNYFMIAALSIGAVQSAHSSPWPTAVEDSATVNTGQRIHIPVLANDIGDGLVITEVNTTTVALGSAQIDSAGTGLYYTSKAGFTGNDSFWYAFKDSIDRTNSTQVFINVIAAVPEGVPTNNDYSGWPVANVDTATTVQNTPITISVLDNDFGDRLVLTEVNDWTVSGGRASIQGSVVSYSPKPGYTGEDSFWYNFTDATGRKNSSQVKVTISSAGTEVPAEPGGNTGVVDAALISMHVDFLKNQRFVWGEVGGMQSMKVAKPASAGSSQLSVKNGFTLQDGQLITYLSSDGEYYTVATSQSSGSTINLKTALPAPIARRGNIWTFYENGSHPNTIGYYALADFALRNNDISALNAGKHVLLGDSWFASPGVKERLAEKLPNAEIINAGVGGQTSADLLARFDTDVAAQNPEIVWLMAGTNDYYQNVSVDAYVTNMKRLIDKINALGAKAMVFDTSVAPSMSGSDALTERSHQYAKALADLLNQ